MFPHLIECVEHVVVKLSDADNQTKHVMMLFDDIHVRGNIIRGNKLNTLVTY